MGIFDMLKSKKTEPVATPTPVASTPVAQAPSPTASNGGGLSLVKSGALSLVKNEAVTIANTKIVARCLWPSTTDYDVYALVTMKDGKTYVVSTFGSDAQRKPTPSILGGKIKHLGDVKRGNGSMAEESIEIVFTDDILSIIPVVYSAQSNGGGSFKHHKVTCEVTDNNGTTVTIPADSANDVNNVYSVAVAEITRNEHGINIKAIEKYSSGGMENRPAFVNGKLDMDAGSKNLYK